MEEQLEQIIDSVINDGYAVFDGFFESGLIACLRNNLLARHEAGLMHPAGVGKHFTFQKNLRVRGDLISWLDEDSDDACERKFFERVGELMRYLNRTCFTALNGCEFHYAFYDEGSFYKRHLDQFHHDSGRKFTMVTYLNDDWNEADGGMLRIYLPDGSTKEIVPLGGRSVFFRADQLEHEVTVAHRQRYSIAGWLLSL
ncbi:MAG: 2OG-Fe(II) oxygenase [Saprospirales bacterium]|jgi:SM-20-related protein|nr:2OG-Fe(II) oxygenase [Saprospirales bacterium]